ncbi:MAG: hypothetical protein M0R77_00485 [Gammaproteobacteria bacterium]|nr:hypothetical protein [Gammaproteobacteria bacterium]
MRLISLELKDFKPLSVNRKRFFKITPKEVVQVILGTNGSGKTSIIKEIVPAAANPQLFRKEGHKEAIYYHNNKHYKIRYEAKTNKHFLFEEQESGEYKNLNEGGTLRVQEETVLSIFKVTPFIRSVLIGEMNFSDLGPQKRRELFTMMSPVPFDYGLEFFAKAKDRLNDTTAILRHNKRKLIDEIAKVMNDEQYEKLQKENKELHHELSILLRERNNQIQPLDKLKKEETDTLVEISRITATIFSTNILAPQDKSYSSISDLREEMVKERELLSSLNTQLSERSAQFEKLSKEVDIVNQSGGQGIEDINAKIEELEKAKQVLISKLRNKIEPHQYKYIKQGLDSESENLLNEIFSTLPLNDDLRFSNTEFKKLKAEDDQLIEKLRQLSLDRDRLNFELNELDKHKANGSISCPECRHSWIIGYDPHQYNKKKTQLDETLTAITQIEERRKELVKDLSDMQEFFNKYKDYIHIRNRNNHLSILWEQLEFDNTAFKYPRHVLSIIDTFQSDCRIVNNILDIDEKLNKELTLFEMVKKIDQQKVSENKAVLTQLELEINQITWNIRTKKEYLNKLTVYYNSLASLINDVKPRLEYLQRHLEDLQGDVIESVRQDILSDLIRSLQSKLALNEDILNKVDYQRGLVEHLQNEITQLEVEEIALKRLIDEVSPTNGLIAEGLMLYINTILDQVNQIIAKVWSYSFKILPCEVKTEGEVGLTYRFPIDIADGLNDIKDIVDGSKAQKEITNLAFRIIAMNYLGFSDAFLFLDEFGDGFDPTHKASAIHAVNTIIEQMNFSQIFMVSHVETSYGALKNNDVCLLNDLNIQVQGVYNEHVEMY